MDLEEIKRGLRAEIKKRENEQYATFQCNVRQMCKDVLDKLEQQEAEIAELKHSLELATNECCAISEMHVKHERRLKRALWLARAELCHRLDVDIYLRKHRKSWYIENYFMWACVAMEVKMCEAESKCRAMAEEYK